MPSLHMLIQRLLLLTSSLAAVHDRCGVRLHVADRKHAVMQQLDLPGELLGFRSCFQCHVGLQRQYIHAAYTWPG